MSPVTVTLKKNPDGSPVLSNLPMRGAVPDYKAACANLAAQVLALNHALDEAQSVEASLRSVIGAKESELKTLHEAYKDIFAKSRIKHLALRTAQLHWSHGWAAKDVKLTVEAALNQ